MKTVWPKVIVSDVSLARCVSDVRLALDDRDQRIIKTVLRRGYTFVAQVSEPVPPPGSGQEAASGVAAPSPHRTAGRAELQRSPGERRQVTIMSCELVGLAALSTRLDPEDLRAAMAACRRCSASVVDQYHGRIARYHIDRMLAYFGHPEAHEHEAEQAVRAALALVDAVEQLRTGQDTLLRVRIGIATGLVIIGDVIEGGTEQEQEVVGETPHVAVQLQTLAQPGQVIIATNTRRLAGAFFEYRGVGAVTLKGAADPIPAWQVISTRAVDSRFEAQRGKDLAPLIGREEELELLLRRWCQTTCGTGRVVLLLGEPGIGKSRLTVELRERLRYQPHATLQYFCSPHHVDSPFHPVAAQLERATSLGRDEPPEANLERLASMLGRDIKEESLLLLAELLSIPKGDRPAVANGTPQHKRRKMLDALLQQLEDMSRRRPVLAVYEDVHWIDPSSHELLHMMVERVATLPVLLIVTGRSEFQASWMDAPHISMLTLTRLDERESTALATLVAGGTGLPDEVVAEIVKRSDGIPIFVEELTKAVLEGVAVGETGSKMVRSGAASALAIPATLQDSLMARLDRLGRPANETAEIGATIGREFSYDLLEPVAQKSESELQSALKRLCEAGLVYCRGVPPHAKYLFKHALVRDAAYGRLLRRRRRALHARIAATLEERFLDVVEQEPELLALHWAEAGSIRQAADYWVKAGRLSRQRHGLVETVAQSRKALALLPMLDDGPDRWRIELQLQNNLGWALFQSQGEGAREAGAAFNRGRILCEQLGDKPTRGLMLFAESNYYISRAEFDAGRRIAEELLHIARECRDTGLEMAAYHALGRSHHWRAEYAIAATKFKGALRDSVPEEHDRFRLADSIRVVSSSHLAVDLMYLGHLDQAVARSDEALAAAAKIGPEPTAMALSYAMVIALWQTRFLDSYLGRSRAAREHLNALVALTKEQNFTFFAALVELQLAIELCSRGQAANGLVLARRAFAVFSKTDMRQGETVRLLLVATCCERAGEIDEALGLLDTGLQARALTGERYFEAELHRHKGRWLVAHRPARRSDAEICYRRALAVARDQQAKFWELLAAIDLASLLREEGQCHAARDLLAPIYGWFTEGIDTLYLKAAKSLLDEL
jgi:class 3 adenylate cyclase/tetratricopeptide (TPR) repeat protein